MRLLVFTPTYGNAMRPECRASIEAQDFAGEWQWVIDDADPLPPPNHRNVLAKYQRARAMAMDGGYDALVTVEHDMVLPEYALTRLAATPGDVIYGTYVLRHGSNVLNLFKYTNGRNLGQSLSLHREDLAAMRRVGQGRVAGVGWGCTLIRRHVLEAIPLHDDQGQNPAGDLAFAAECNRAGLMSIGLLDVACWHIEGDVWLYPWGETMAAMVECLANQTINAMVDGQVVRLERGQWHKLPLATAQELQRAGYVKVFEPEVLETATVKVAKETAVARRR